MRDVSPKEVDVSIESARVTFHMGTDYGLDVAIFRVLSAWCWVAFIYYEMQPDTGEPSTLTDWDTFLLAPPIFGLMFLPWLPVAERNIRSAFQQGRKWVVRLRANAAAGGGDG